MKKHPFLASCLIAIIAISAATMYAQELRTSITLESGAVVKPYTQESSRGLHREWIGAITFVCPTASIFWAIKA